MGKWIRIAGAVTTVAALIVAVAGCGSSSSSAGTTKNASGMTSLTVGVPPVVEIGDLFTAKSRGYFAKQHLAVTIKDLSGGAALVPALQSGALDVGQSNLVSVLQGEERQLSVKCFSGAYHSPTGPELSLLVSQKDKSTITEASQLAGKTIAVNTLANSNQLVTDVWLAKHGVNPSTVHFVALQFPDMPGALSSGRVAAAITDEPFTTISRSQGAEVLSADPDEAIASHPEYPCWVATSSWLSSHKAVASRFVAALSEADSYIASHPSYVRSILPQYTSLSKKLAAQVTLPNWSTSLTAADIKPWSVAAAKYKITGAAVAPSSILDLVSGSTQ